MQYAIIIYESEEDLDKRGTPEISEAYAAYTKSLIEAGLMRGGQALEHPQLATVVARRHGEVILHDGPYADTKEQLGGFYVIDAEDLDQAIEWAARCPAAQTGKVEVRPIMAPPA